ncbi:MAG: DUF1553 domain-containing protein [Verrucomicrobiales bacterium]|nr:DUF1553 domain-containing protein [Verrucomicrobiales bacterium]
MNRILVIGVIVAGFATPGHGQDLARKIDALIDAANAEAGQPVAEIADDAEFFRRVNLDFSGVIPTVEESKQFLADTDPNKRARAIDRLLGDTENYARRMREAFHVHLMERRGENKLWQAWLEKSFAENKPWDQITREIIRADFRDEPNRGAAFFYTKRLEKSGQNPTDYPGLTRDVGRLFLGIDLQCAECHNHRLIDDYNQIDFQGLFAAFSNLTLLRLEYPAVEEKLMKSKLEYASVFTGKPREVAPRIPGLGEIEVAVFEKGEEYVQVPDRKTKTPGVPKFSPLTEFAKQIPESPNFSKNMANRLWFLLMGRGLVEPMDQFHSENQASHPELLELLGQEFATKKFDIKWLLRELALTKTYQRASRIPEEKVAPPERFAVAVQRRLSAEQLMWSTILATGHEPDNVQLEDIEPEDDDADEIPGLRSRFHDAMANEPKTPEYEFSPSMKSALLMMNDPEVLKLIDAMADENATVDGLYLQIFSRLPDADEKAEWTKFLTEAKDRRAAVRDLAWAMLTSTEFVVNH